jgi:glycosyltransferase involved in cell wall biosynthesis
MAPPALSVVIPVYNEEAVLPALFARLYPALDALGTSYEVVFVNDGSQDRSAALLREQFQARPDVTRVILFNGNFGQHMAILGGFEHVRGGRIVTLDADLQNPPEEIAKLLAKMDEGHDYVGSIRRMRQDAAWRRLASKAMNRMRERITHIKMTDQGCMLRAYSRSVVDAVNSCREINTFIPALAFTFAERPTEKSPRGKASPEPPPWVDRRKSDSRRDRGASFRHIYCPRHSSCFEFTPTVCRICKSSARSALSFSFGVLTSRANDWHGLFEKAMLMLSISRKERGWSRWN